MESSMGLKGGLLGQSHSSALTTEVSAFPLDHWGQPEVQEQRRKLKNSQKNQRGFEAQTGLAGCVAWAKPPAGCHSLMEEKI